MSVVRFLVARWQGSVRSMSREGWLPVHEAAMCGSRDAVRYLVAQWPSSVRATGKGGWLPIHAAVRLFKAHERRGIEGALGVARFLVGQHPQSVWATTDDGCLPIHLAAGFAPFLRCIDNRDSNDSFEYWRPVATEMELRLVRFLVRQAPTTLRILSRDGKLPVHVAVEEGLSLPTHQYLWESWPAEEGSPASVQFRTGKGLTALHLAAGRKDPSLEHVVFLVRLRSQMLIEADPEGRLPVHYAVECEHPSPDVCRFLVEQRPGSLGHAANDGSLPLHLCFNRKAPSLERVQYLVGRHPQALEVKDGKGSLPLHAALSQGQVPHGLVDFMVEQEPRSLRQKDWRGLLPLHVAAVHDASLDVLYYLASVEGSRIRALGTSLQRAPAPAPAPAQASETELRQCHPALRRKIPDLSVCLSG